MPAKKKKTTATAKTQAAESTLKATEKTARKPVAKRERSAAARTASPAATHKSAAKKAVRTVKAPKSAFQTHAHHDEISREAYLLWLASGCAHGTEQDDWFRAVEIVRRRHDAA